VTLDKAFAKLTWVCLQKKKNARPAKMSLRIAKRVCGMTYLGPLVLHLSVDRAWVH
jgi:hypothetical protein